MGEILAKEKKILSKNTWSIMFLSFYTIRDNDNLLDNKSK